MKKLLITGAGGSAANNFIKSLKMSNEDFYVVGTDINKFHLEITKVDKKYILPKVSDSTYLLKLNELIEKEGIEFVHAQPDVEVAFISKNRKKIKARTYLPKSETIEICQNKVILVNKLFKEGLSVPESYHIKGKKFLKSAVKKLLKNNDKLWVRAIRGAGSRAALPIKSYNQALCWINYWRENRGLRFTDFMISEFLPGREYAFQSIWKDGEIITSQARERMEYLFGNITPSGQTSTPSIAKTVHNDVVNKLATKAVLTIDKEATGIFCIDMKENKEGKPCVTEINAGRFFTTSNFFAKAGSNMPYYYLKMAYGENIPELPKYNAIQKDLYWVRVVDAGYKLIRGKEWTSQKI